MNIVFSSHLFWVPLLFISSFLLAYFLYAGLKKPSYKVLKYPVFLLLILRTLGLFLLSILLLAPYLKYETKVKHKPGISFLLDESLSVKNQDNIETYYSDFIRKAKLQLKDL